MPEDGTLRVGGMIIGEDPLMIDRMLPSACLGLRPEIAGRDDD